MALRSMDDTSGLRLLGGGSLPREMCEPSADILETFPNTYPHRNYIINFNFPEFTSLCPVTGQPDFGVINMEYIPDRLCVESKSFKLYMFSFRNYQSFMETITNTILEDLVSRLDPCWCGVKGLFAPRGATRIHVYTEHYKPLETVRRESVHQAVRDWRMEKHCKNS